MQKLKKNKKLYKLVCFTLIFTLIITSAFPSMVFAKDVIKTHDNWFNESSEFLAEAEKQFPLKVNEYPQKSDEKNTYPLEPIIPPPPFNFDENQGDTHTPMEERVPSGNSSIENLEANYQLKKLDSEMNKEYQQLISILENYQLFSELSVQDAEFICTYCLVNDEAMKELEANGKFLSESFAYANIEYNFGIAIKELLQSCATTQECSDLYSELNIYRTLADANISNMKDEYVQYIIDGYKAKYVLTANEINLSLNISMDKLLSTDNVVPFEVYTNISELDRQNYKLYAEALGVSETALVEYAIENRLEFQEMEELVEATIDSSIITPEQKNISQQSASTINKSVDIINPEKQIGIPLSYDYNYNESINLNTGSLMYEVIDEVLPGRNGLDLVIGRRYDSEKANVYNALIKITDKRADHVFRYYYSWEAYLYSPEIGEVRFTSYDVKNQSSKYFYMRSDATKWFDSLEDVRKNNFDGTGKDLILKPVAGHIKKEDIFHFYDSIDSMNPNTYLDSLYGLGTGWSFMFSYIYNNCLYLSDGTSYNIVMTSTSGDSNLDDYKCADFRIEKESGYSNGSVNSEYTLYHKDGKKEFFSSDGKLIGIRDRFNNQINFVHTTVNGRPQIKITDSLNRNINISSSSNNSQTDLTVVTLPEGELKYTVSIDSGTEKIRSLTKFENQLNQSTHYSYNVCSGEINFCRMTAHTYTNKFVNLTTITYPTNYQTKYKYDSYTRNFPLPTGSDATCSETAYRINTRYDELGGFKNKKTYTYSSNNFSGYPSWKSEPDSTTGFTYSTTVMDEITNIATTSTFDYEHLLKKEESKKLDSGKLVKIMEVQYDSYKLPTKNETIAYNSFNDNFMKTVSVQENDSFGNIIALWSPLAEGNKNNTDYKTTYAYDNNYNQMLSKTYKQNTNTVILEQNTLSSQNKTIGVSEILVNGIRKEKTSFDYDSYGNILSINKYKDGFTDYEQTKYTYINGVYLSEIKNEGIKDPGGVLISGTPGYSAGTIVTKCPEYDIMGRVKKVIDANGNATTYDYNYLGDLIKKTNPDGTVVECSINYILNTVTVKDENGHKTKSAYTPDGLECSKYLINDQTNENIMMVRKDYDSNNRLLRYNNLLTGSSTNYTYDHLSRITSKKTTDSSNTIISSETYSFDEAYGSEKLYRIQKTVNGDQDAPSIVSTEYTNNVGQLVKTGKFLGGVEYFNTYIYDYDGNNLEERSAYAASMNLPYSTKCEYDYAGRAIKCYNTNGDYTITSYDALGRNVSNTDYTGATINYSYDGIGRLLEECEPIATGHNKIQKNYYDSVGNIIKSYVTKNIYGLPPITSRIYYDYDMRNRLQYVTIYDNNNIDNVTKYTYDGVGNKLSMGTGMSSKTADDGHITTYTYDILNRIKTLTDPLNQTESYTYKSNGYQTQYGLMDSKIDRNGNITNYTYDGLSRMSSMKITTPEGNVEQSYYGYTLTGAKKSESNANNATTCKYNELGCLIQENETGGIVKNYTYDIANNRKTFTTALNNTVMLNLQYSYDNMSRLKHVYDNNTLQATYTYDVNGRCQKLEYPNGNSENYNYNMANWLTRIENRNRNNDITSSYDYTYYADGNHRTKTDHNGRVTTYLYDGAGRLKSETEGNGLNISYIYDRFSNRKSMAVSGSKTYAVSYDYDINNRLLKDTKTEDEKTIISNYSYDPNGNQIAKMTEILLPTSNDQSSVNLGSTGAELYEYDGANHLIRSLVDGNEVTYTYRIDGLRSSKTTLEGTTTHIWDGQNIAADLKNGAIGTRYIRGINLIKSDNDSNGQKYYLYNGHGDVVQLAGTDGNVLWNYEYDAFGNERQIEGQDSTLDNNSFRYSGEYFDKETGTIYLRARNYDSEIGRFTTEDSYHGNITDPLSLNLYTYCHNNPLRFFDPTGHYTEKEAKAVRDGLKSKNLLDKVKAVAKGTSIVWRDRYNNAKNYYTNRVEPRARESAAIALDMSTGYLGGEITGGLIKSAEQVIKGAGKAVKGASKAAKADFYVTPSGEAIPSTGYRYMPEDASYLNGLNKTKTIPANSRGTYFSFDKYDVATPEKLQVPHDASIRGSFDTLQIIDDIRIPNGNWGKANYLEPIIKDFPEHGIGGARQAITKHQIILYEITQLHK